MHDALRAACAEVGIVYRDVPADGRWYETDLDGDRRGRGDGRIRLFPGGEGGIVCNWKGETRPFFAADDSTLTDAERTERDRKRREVIRQIQQEEARRRAEAARKAAAIWEVATAAKADHPYLSRKQVSPAATLREADAGAVAALLDYAPKSRGEPLAGRLLVAPVKIGIQMSTAELIDEAGRKSAIAGGAKAGGYWAAQPLPEGDGAGLTLLIGEGVATILSATEATGCSSIAALSCGNLPAVARAMRERYPAARLVILADMGNGQKDAEDAARSVGGLVALPDFGPNRPDDATDFNDMAALRGLEAVRRCIEAARAEAEAVTLETDVTDVTDVQPSNDGDFTVTAGVSDAVTGVTATGPSSVPESDRPCFKVFDAGTTLRESSNKLRPGVWHFGIKAGKNAEPPSLTQQWVCSPLYIAAVSFDGQENNFGRLLRFRNTLGRWRKWAMPMELLRGAGDDLRGELLAMGVQIDPNAHRLLGQYLQATTPKRRVRCALQVGWCGDVFVLPDEVIGPKAAGVIFQSGERGHDEHTRAGTLEGWRVEIAARAVGNPLLVLALSVSFAGPLLARCNAEGGGIHFVGDSSTGKTTAIEAACATWGGPSFRRSWRATANGMEGAAALFNDSLLALDEISECDPREVGAIVYALGNGRGKQRASRTGTARSVTRWRCFVLSSGERTIGTTMAEGGYRVKAGQSVRLLDIPATRRFGAWDELHDSTTGTAFSDALKRASVTHHGHAGRAFLEKLTRDRRDFCERLERLKALPEFSADGGEGQDKRAAGRFALLALAGEVATEYGITGWPEGAAINAAAEGFRAWRSWRGRGNDERWQILERVASFIERHGDGRFSDAGSSLGEAAPIRDRAGWWRDAGSDGRIYLFTADGLREASKGFDFKRVLDTLQEAGALPKPDESGERAKPQRIGGRLVRLYSIHADQLSGNHGA
ncbi:MAG: DUF927 domain-containing protein [Candidatus Competibacter sp.]|nr:DUF927 domain-containing protein [Candidatus Competibacter sp.]